MSSHAPALVLANATADMGNINDEELNRISSDPLAWHVSMSDYPEDSDLEDEDEPELETEQDESKRESATETTNMNNGRTEEDKASANHYETTSDNKPPATHDADFDSDRTEVRVVFSQHTSGMSAHMSQAKVDDFVSVDDVLSAEEACPSPSLSTGTQRAGTFKATTTDSTSECSTGDDDNVFPPQAGGLPRSGRRTVLTLDIAFRTYVP